MGSNLEFIIPLDRQILTKTPYGYVSEKNETFRVIGIADELSGQQYDEIHFYENWLSIKTCPPKYSISSKSSWNNRLPVVAS